MHLPMDHVAIAVDSIAAALPILESLFGAGSSPIEHIPSQGVAVSFIGTGPGRIELIEPTAPESPVSRFLAKRGPGLHHIALRVPDLDAALEHYASAGVELIDRVPRQGAHGHRVAFLHPRSTGGVLIELVTEQDS